MSNEVNTSEVPSTPSSYFGQNGKATQVSWILLLSCTICFFLLTTYFWLLRKKYVWMPHLFCPPPIVRGLLQRKNSLQLSHPAETRRSLNQNLLNWLIKRMKHIIHVITLSTVDHLFIQGKVVGYQIIQTIDNTNIKTENSILINNRDSITLITGIVFGLTTISRHSVVIRHRHLWLWCLTPSQS